MVVGDGGRIGLLYDSDAITHTQKFANNLWTYMILKEITFKLPMTQET